MLKDFTLSLELEPTENRVVQTAAIFWSHDVNTAKIYIELLRKGTPIILNKDVTVRVMMLFDDENKSEHIYTAKIEDELKGLVSITLEESMRMYVGQVTCGVYVDYQNEEKTDNGYFTFGMRRSLIDKDMPELQKLYVSDFEKALEDIKEFKVDIDKNIIDMTENFNSNIKEMQEELNKKYDNANDKINEINKHIAENDVATKQDLNKVDVEIEETKLKITDINESPRNFGAVFNGKQDDTKALKDTLKHLKSKNGGKMLLPKAVINISETLAIPKNVVVEGAGRGLTILKSVEGFEGNCIEFETQEWKSGETYQQLLNLSIDGNNTANNGVLADSSLTYTRVENIEVYNCLGDGIKYVSAHRNILKNSDFFKNKGHGLTIISQKAENGSGFTDNHLEMDNIGCYNNGLNGFNFIEPVDLRASNLMATVNGKNGFYIKEPRGNWCNMLNNVGAQGNKENGFDIYGGATLSMNNVSSGSSGIIEVRLEKVNHVNLSNLTTFSNMSLESSLVVRQCNYVNLSNINVRHRKEADYAMEISYCTNSSFTNTVLEGAKNGLRFYGINFNNDINSLTTFEQTEAGVLIALERAGTNNFFNGISIRGVLNEGAIPFKIKNANELILSGLKVTYRDVVSDYAVVMEKGRNCVFSNSIAQGKKGGIKLPEPSETTIVSDTFKSLIID